MCEACHSLESEYLNILPECRLPMAFREKTWTTCAATGPTSCLSVFFPSPPALQTAWWPVSSSSLRGRLSCCFSFRIIQCLILCLLCPFVHTLPSITDDGAKRVRVLVCCTVDHWPHRADTCKACPDVCTSDQKKCRHC